MPKKVIVIGGGVAGMTVAHELVSREFDVVVYELRDIPGGKARSMDAGEGGTGRQPLPGEHGFRFFPGFYRHLPDSMKRVPIGDGRTALDNLCAATQMEMAREGGQSALISPAEFPTSVPDWEAALRSAVQYETELGIPLDEQVRFTELLGELLSACQERRFSEYENESWWDFSGAEKKDCSRAYRKFLADGLTRTLVAAKAKQMSARTGGYILLQLLQDMAQPGVQVDRLLNAPTNKAWIDPWLAELERLGVEYRLSHRVEAVRSHGWEVTGVAGHEVSWPEQAPGGSFEDQADYYVAAVPVEVMQSEINMPLRRWVPELRNLDRLTYRWMNGIMFYLAEDIPLVHGHVIFIDSAWALTAVSQRQFWPGVDFRKLGDGRVNGILSVDISDWEANGNYVVRKPARECSRQEIADEVWAQLKAALNSEREVLRDENRLRWFLDPDIVTPNPATAATNLEPLLVNTTGSWNYRPEASLPDVPNLFLASDYVRTYTDLATMEGANEAGRRAVNAILDASSSNAKRCELWTLQEPGGPFILARLIDGLVYRLFGSRRRPPSTASLLNGHVQTRPLTAGLRRLFKG